MDKMEQYDEEPNDSGGEDGDLPSKLFGKRRRTTFNLEQRKLLEDQFARNPYPDTLERKRLATSLGVKDSSIMWWFGHRRAKEVKKKDRDYSGSSSVPVASMFYGGSDMGGAPHPWNPTPVPTPTGYQHMQQPIFGGYTDRPVRIYPIQSLSWIANPPPRPPLPNVTARPPGVVFPIPLRLAPTPVRVNPTTPPRARNSGLHPSSSRSPPPVKASSPEDIDAATLLAFMGRGGAPRKEEKRTAPSTPNTAEQQKKRTADALLQISEAASHLTPHPPQHLNPHSPTLGPSPSRGSVSLTNLVHDDRSRRQLFEGTTSAPENDHHSVINPRTGPMIDPSRTIHPTDSARNVRSRVADAERGERLPAIANDHHHSTSARSARDDNDSEHNAALALRSMMQPERGS